MWTWLASLLGAPVVKGLIKAYRVKLDVANTQDRIAADLATKEIEAQIEARKQSSNIIIAEQGRWGREGRAHVCETIMTNEELLRERVAKLEVQMMNLPEKSDDTHQKVGQMRAILLQAKGARWVILDLQACRV